MSVPSHVRLTCVAQPKVTLTGECMNLDLSTANGRYKARKYGFNVPKMRPGKPSPDFDSLLRLDGACLVFIGKRNRDGYGQYSFDMKKHLAHRWAYVKETGKNIDGLVLMHSCDNPACCSIEHLVIGTHRDNQLDKVKKGRHAFGEKLGSSKLTEADVLEIRRSYIPRTITYKMLAKKYGVCKDTIQKCVTCKYWKHVNA